MLFDDSRSQDAGTLHRRQAASAPRGAEVTYDAACGDTTVGCCEVGCDDLVCSVCLDPIRARAWRTLACGHSFHESCVLKWAQSASKPHCPLCRFDLEASALAEFDKAFGLFQQKITVSAVRASNLWEIVSALEDSRRRIFDAALVRFQKLHQEDTGSGAYECELELLQEDRLLFTELLCQLHALRLVLLDLRRQQRDVSSIAAVVSPETEGMLVEEDDTTAMLLTNLGEALHGVQVLMKRICASGGEEHMQQSATRESLKQYVSRISEMCAIRRTPSGQILSPAR